MFVFFSMVCFSGLHKAKLGSQIKKLFWQFHYFSKAAAAHITQDIAPKPFFSKKFLNIWQCNWLLSLKLSYFGNDIEII